MPICNYRQCLCAIPAKKTSIIYLTSGLVIVKWHCACLLRGMDIFVHAFHIKVGNKTRSENISVHYHDTKCVRNMNVRLLALRTRNL